METGWGKFIPTDKDTGRVNNNLFGIKGTGPAGSVACATPTTIFVGSQQGYLGSDKKRTGAYKYSFTPR
ncbi:MAG TPA: hypothetical protein DCW46_03195 [Desulfotomaculum sp.]|nr:hypothetical protein [Desulfotomaculum sp.]